MAPCRATGLAAGQALLGLLLATCCHAISSNDYVTVSRIFFASSEEEVQGIIGQRVVLPCEFIADGVAKPQFNVIWQKDKKTLTFNKNFVDDPRLSISPTDVNTKNRFDLQISELMASDEGLYRCITSYENQFYVKNVTLVVKVPPTIDETKSSAPLKTLVEGDSYALLCQARGVPEPTITWYKMIEQPHVAAMNKEKIAVGEGPRYAMSSVTRNCDGVFMCIASNGIHPPAHKKFEITVNYKPVVSLVNEEISQRRGLSTMVMCVITGNPLTSYYWEYRSVQLRASGPQLCYPPERAIKYCVHTSSLTDTKHMVQMDLTINNLTAEDYGLYYCVAKSSLGEDRKAAQVLEVEDTRPEIYTRRPPPPKPPSVHGASTASDSVQNKYAPDSLTSRSNEARGSSVATVAASSGLAAVVAASTVTAAALTVLLAS